MEGKPLSLIPPAQCTPHTAAKGHSETGAVPVFAKQTVGGACGAGSLQEGCWCRTGEAGLAGHRLGGSQQHA